MQRPILEYPIISAAAIARRRFVTYAGAQAVAGDRALGVSDYEASGAGKQVNVIVLGTARINSGGVFAVGDALQSDAQGRAILAAAGVVNARALQASTAADQTVEVLLIKS